MKFWSLYNSTIRKYEKRYHKTINLASNLLKIEKSGLKFDVEILHLELSNQF